MDGSQVQLAAYLGGLPADPRGRVRRPPWRRRSALRDAERKDLEVVVLTGAAAADEEIQTAAPHPLPHVEACVVR